jgi:hypothetical protein
MLNCPNCGAANAPINRRCASCDIAFYVSPKELNELREALKNIQKEFTRKQDALFLKISWAEKVVQYNEQRLNLLEKQGYQEEIIVTEPPVQEPIIVQELPKKEVTIEQNIDEINRKAREKAEKAQETFLHDKPKSQPKVKPKKTEAEKMAESNAFIDLLTPIILGPFVQFKDYFTEVYQYYKEQNRLPAFFLTIGGSIALLLGFGYLLQVTSAEAFEVIKVLVTFASAFAAIFWGTRLHRNAKFRDFGGAMLGLGLSINYLAIYFLSYSPVLQFFTQAWAGSILILLNTALAAWLAMRYETKVVLVISLAGGALAPFYLQANVIGGLYFAYLWLLCATTIFIGQAIRWRTVSTLAFLASAAVLEVVVFQYRVSLNTPQMVLTLMAFAYLFFWLALFDGRKVKEKLASEDVFNLAGNAAILVLNIYTVMMAANLQRPLGYVLLGNAAIFLFLFVLFRSQATKQMQLLFFILAGSFAAIAAPQLFERNVSGVFWAIEGLALVFCGFVFTLNNVRKEGYIVLVLGVVKILWTTPEILLFWGQRLWTDGFVNLASLGVVLVLAYALLWVYRGLRLGFEQQIFYWVQEIFSVWLAAVCWTVLYFHFRLYAFNWAIVGLYVFIVWGSVRRLFFTEWLGYVHFWPLFLGVIASATQQNSWLFRDQTLLGKIAMTEIFLSLWVIKLVYDRLLPERDRKNTAGNATIYLSGLLCEIFYLLLPVGFLGTIMRLYPNYFPAALWLSVLVAFVVREVTKRITVLIELHLLVGGATLVLIWQVWQMLNFNNNVGTQLLLYAVAFGLFDLLLIFGVKKGWSRSVAEQSPYRLLFIYAFYFPALCLFLIELYWLRDIGNTGLFLLPALYLAGITALRRFLAPIHNRYIPANRLGKVMLTLALPIFLLTNPSNISAYFVLFIPVFLLMYWLIYADQVSASKKTWQATTIWLHLATSVSFAGVLPLFFADGRGIWLSIFLFVQAIALLFNAFVKRFGFLLRLSVVYFLAAIAKVFFLDLADAGATQKVIVFMVVGVLMLAGSFVFMKFKSRQEKEETDE